MCGLRKEFQDTLLCEYNKVQKNTVYSLIPFVLVKSK